MPPVVDITSAPPVVPETGRVVDEEFWANLLKQKASLEIDITKLKDELSAKSIEIVELKQKNEELGLQVARSRTTKKGSRPRSSISRIWSTVFPSSWRGPRMTKIHQRPGREIECENENLRQQMKQLVSVKNALEKSIVRLSQEKDKVEGKLGKTETLIQSKIDEIWEIKDDLDRSIRSANTRRLPVKSNCRPLSSAPTASGQL